jgi:hypothetical protein
MHWLSVLSYAFILHIRNPARQQRKKSRNFKEHQMLSLHWILRLYLPSRMQKVKNQDRGDYNSS